MSILVVGSVAFDNIETPFGKVKDVVGGSAIYFSISASFFVPVKLVAVMGHDFPKDVCRFLTKRNVNLDGLETVDGLTFRWEGRYGNDLNVAETINTELNVFSNFSPKLPVHYRDAEYIFLANINPELQEDVIKQVRKPKIIACDTMNHWIRDKRDALIKTLGRVDIVVINEGEARLLAQEQNLIKAGKKILDSGIRAIVIKRGEYGALYMDKKTMFMVPAYPLEKVSDPTGAGDSFGGGFMGYLAKSTRNVPKEKIFSRKYICEAVIHGSIMGSFCVEDFSINMFKQLNLSDIKKRYNEFAKFISF